MIEDWRHGGFGLYVHWPYCESKCPYCDFNSHVAARIDHHEWADAYAAEVARVGRQTRERVLDSVYLGGGTPSLMSYETVSRLLTAIREAWPLSNQLEVTLEANPSSVEVNKFKEFRDAGVNRVSLGVQALNDRDLIRLGRRHGLDDALRAIEVAQSTFDRTSFDLIYARQDQSLAEWERELKDALALAAGHLSLYQLTIEPGTAFAARHANGGLPGLPADELAADMYELTLEMCHARGYNAYEVSNLSKIGEESRHNLVYWRSGDYAGIGPGAHGRLTLDGERYATVAASSPAAWLDAVARQQAQRYTALSRSERALEYLLMGLRLSEPLNIDRFEALSDQAFPREAAHRLADMGLISIDANGVSATRKGRLLLNSVLVELAAGLDQ